MMRHFAVDGIPDNACKFDLDDNDFEFVFIPFRVSLSLVRVVAVLHASSFCYASLFFVVLPTHTLIFKIERGEREVVV